MTVQLSTDQVAHLRADDHVSLQDSARRRARFQEVDLTGPHPLVAIIRMLDMRWWQWLGMSLLFVMKNACVWGWPLAMAEAIDIVTQPELFPYHYVLIPFGWYAMMLAVNIPGHVWFINRLSERLRFMEKRLRSTLVRRLQQLSMYFHSESESGRLQTKVVRDVENVELLSRQVCQNASEALLNILAAIVIVSFTEPIVLMFYIIAAPCCVVAVRLFNNNIKRRNRVFRQDVESMGSHVSEMLDLIPVTRAHGVEKKEIKKVEGRLNQIRKSGQKLDTLTAFFHAVIYVMMHISLGGALFFFCWLAYFYEMSAAEIILYMALFGMIVNSLMMLVNLYPQLMKGFESVRSLADILESPELEMNEGKDKVSFVRGRIGFENVSFAYPNRDKLAMDEFSINVKAGECIAFVGESGSGKSTAMNLIIGFYKPKSGRITLDGRDMDHLDLRTWRQHLAVVPQQVILFSGTIKDNILYGIDDVSDERLQEVIEAANLADVIDQLPQGLYTMVGENGVQLSGGQRQRLAIARALIRDPKVIILDEATSALDVISEKQVQEAIDRLVEGRTTFVVAHRLSTIRKADRVVVMKEGKMVELGPEQELVKQGGEFARLKALQA